MTDVRIGIIVGSTRPGRHARAVAEWVLEQTAARTGARYEIVDLADYPLPHLDEPMPPLLGSISTTTPRHGRPPSMGSTASSL